MRATKIRLVNWGCFKGEHELTLDAGVYAVFARHEDDELRSNWLGKSTFLRVLRFALDGAKPKGCRFEDDWITDGESEGLVHVEYDDGLEITRQRRRGSSTQLTIHYLEGREVKKARQKRAQEIIDQRTGLTDYDFSFFEQKEMSKIVEERSSKLFEQASRWFRLGKIVEGHARLRDKLNTLIADRDKLRAVMGDDPLQGASIEDFESDLAELREKVKARVAATEQADEELREAVDLMAKAENAREYERLRDEAGETLKRLKAMKPKQLSEDVDELGERVGALKAEVDAAQREVAKRRKLATGDFDGTCPVSCEACPVPGQVREVLVENTDAVDRARQIEMEARERLNVERGSLAKKRAKLEEACDLKRDFERAKTRGLSLRDDYRHVQEVGEPEEDLKELKENVRASWEEVADLKAKLKLAERAIDQAKEAQEERSALADKLADVDEQVALYRAAVHVWGRQGAQRLVAETALGQIKRLANKALQEAGIDLSVEVQWAREASSGLASHCEMCGHPFPRSQRVKVCEKCSSRRGPKMIDELSVEPSNTSGAADDLAGIAFKLGLAAWRRDKQGARLGVATLDEPLAYVDEANKRAVAGHVASMLSSRYGFDQSFVTAHDRAVLDALPKRVEIIAGEEGSRFA